MFVTGRLALLVALGVVPLVLLSTAGVPAWLAVGGWVVLCAVGALVDVAVAADPRAVEITRRLPDRTLLDEPVAGELHVRNLGTRALRARVRDAWQPTAGAPEERARFVVPPGERRSGPLPLLPRRRG
ncbi:lipoprotein, partial [Microbacterium testaceum]